jgi:hypothetical protein
MLEKTTEWLIEFFMGLSLPFEAALLLTIATFFIIFAVLVCAGEKIIKTHLCRPLRRYIDESYKEDDTYRSNEE